MGKVFKDGLIGNNPILVQLIGLCSVLAVSNTVTNAFFMGIAVIFVVTLSNIFISLFRKVIPDKIRIPVFIIIIATFVTLVDMLLNAFVPAVHAQLGIFIPLIVVNCLILGRAEAFASKNGIASSIVDGIGMGIGYTMAILSMSILREFFGTGMLAGYQILPQEYPGIGIFTSPAGSFIVLGIVISLFRWAILKIENRKAQAPLEPLNTPDPDVAKL